MKFVDGETVRRVLTFPKLIAALETAHRRPKMEVQDAFLGNENAQYLVRHGVDGGRLIGSKLITSFPANLAGGKLPAIQAVCVLFDGTDGRPLAVIDGTEITTWRTAADSALGANYLAPPLPKVMLVLGAGAMAEPLVYAHRCVRPSIERVLIWNRTAERATDLAERLRRQDTDAVATADLDAAVKQSDLISSCTRSHVPLIKGAKLKPGTHVDLVGSYTPQTREADDEAVRKSLIFVDRRESALHSAGDILQPLANGTISEAGILGDLYDLVNGQVAGRLSSSDITLFKNAGGGHLDLMTCEAVLGELGSTKDGTHF
jgi:ornithine cyclodeaminase/alanine dehydrogenase-like protein (mu-crystallin family)